MATLGAALKRVEPGEVDVDLPFRPDLTRQHGFLHQRIGTSVMDTACGYAALTSMEPGVAVLTIELKVNLLAPARGSRFLASGRVVGTGRTVSVDAGELRTVEPDSGENLLVAMVTATMMTVRDRPELVD